MKKTTHALLVSLLAASFAAGGQTTSNISFPHVDKTVYGSITIPPGTGPFPAIVLAPGSGAVDRDGTITMAGGNVQCLYPGLNGTTIRPYKELGDALAAAGYVVLRYNKLEYSYGSNLGAITFNKLWLPFESAIDYVKKRPEVDSTKIILIGHSEGSALIPFVTKSRFDVIALVSLAGARTPFDSILGRQIIDITQLCGGNMSQAQAQVNAVLAYFNDIRTGNWNSSTPPLFGVPADAWSDYVQATDPVAQNYDLSARPTLFLGLGDDFNVPPSELARFQNEVTIPADFWSVPGVNHYMTYSATPTIAKAVPDTIIYWLSKLNLVTDVKQTAPNTITSLSPNPSTGYLFLSLAGDVTDVVISDINGRALIHKAVSANELTIGVADLVPGLYFVEARGPAGVQVRKFLKE